MDSTVVIFVITILQNVLDCNGINLRAQLDRVFSNRRTKNYPNNYEIYLRSEDSQDESNDHETSSQETSNDPPDYKEYDKPIARVIKDYHKLEQGDKWKWKNTELQLPTDVPIEEDRFYHLRPHQHPPPAPILSPRLVPEQQYNEVKSTPRPKTREKQYSEARNSPRLKIREKYKVLPYNRTNQLNTAHADTRHENPFQMPIVQFREVLDIQRPKIQDTPVHSKQQQQQPGTRYMVVDSQKPKLGSKEIHPQKSELHSQK